ncbi:MAG: hypothetical protein RI883_1895 [Bacteroidota bacterium]|jgi:2',3'-cyclic-nucleotide 2'-phosphodiesterase (5'-nucleotidase family)
MKFKFISIFFIGAGLWACSSVNTLIVHSDTDKMDNEHVSNVHIDSVIMPYKDSLSLEMNEIIAASLIDFSVKRPNSNLGNWVADALFVNQTKTVRLSTPIICLLNTGGIRSTINKGDITIGDMFKLMPFDNEIVWVELPVSVIPEIEEYLKKSGGEPISNCMLKNGKLVFNNWNENASTFWVITSDYLMNGGDKMAFFSKKINVNNTGVLMRDALITEARIQTVLQEDTIIRISF